MKTKIGIIPLSALVLSGCALRPALRMDIDEMKSSTQCSLAIAKSESDAAQQSRAVLMTALMYNSTATQGEEEQYRSFKLLFQHGALDIPTAKTFYGSGYAKFIRRAVLEFKEAAKRPYYITRCYDDTAIFYRTPGNPFCIHISVNKNDENYIGTPEELGLGDVKPDSSVGPQSLYRR